MHTRSTLARLKDSYRTKEPLERNGPMVARSVYRPLSFYLAVPFAWLKITGNQVTLLRLPVALTGAGLIATGGRWAVVVGCSLYALGTLLDYVDGNLARFYGAVSSYGDTLDHLVHIVEKTILPFALGIGLCRRSDWLLRLINLARPEIVLGTGSLGSILQCLTMTAVIEGRLIALSVNLKTQEAVDVRSAVRRRVAKLAYRTAAEASYCIPATLLLFSFLDATSAGLLMIAVLQVFAFRDATRGLLARLRVWQGHGIQRPLR
jgi:hypothetical protein